MTPETPRFAKNTPSETSSTGNHLEFRSQNQAFLLGGVDGPPYCAHFLIFAPLFGHIIFRAVFETPPFLDTFARFWPLQGVSGVILRVFFEGVPGGFFPRYDWNLLKTGSFWVIFGDFFGISRDFACFFAWFWVIFVRFWVIFVRFLINFVDFC